MLNDICKNVILDTDIGPDCDDAGALAILHTMADKGEVNILGVGHCTSSPYGAGCIDAINLFYKRGDIPVGTLNKKDFLTGNQYEIYNKYIVENYENRYRNNTAIDAVKLYRKILSEQIDGSVTFVAIGPLVNLANLLASQPDEYSHLDGNDLVKKKVSLLVTMAGKFESEENGQLPAEWNVFVDILSAQTVTSKWPTPIVFCGCEVGEHVITGKRLMYDMTDRNPVKKAYELFTKGAGRSSWDLETVLYAVRGECGLWKLSRPGKVHIDDLGVSHFFEMNNGSHKFMINDVSISTIEEYIEQLLTFS